MSTNEITVLIGVYVMLGACIAVEIEEDVYDYALAFIVLYPIVIGYWILKTFIKQTIQLFKKL